MQEMMQLKVLKRVKVYLDIKLTIMLLQVDSAEARPVMPVVVEMHTMLEEAVEQMQELVFGMEKEIQILVEEPVGLLLGI